MKKTILLPELILNIRNSQNHIIHGAGWLEDATPDSWHLSACLWLTDGATPDSPWAG